MINTSLVSYYKTQQPEVSTLRMLFAIPGETDMTAKDAIKYAEDYPERLANILDIIDAEIEMTDKGDNCKIFYK